MSNGRQKRAKPSSSLPLPRKAAAEFRGVQLEVGQKQVPKELARVLKKTFKEAGHDIIADLSEVYGTLKKRFAAQLKDCSIADAFTLLNEIETSILEGNPTFAATVPIA